MSEVVVAPPVSPTPRARAATRELWLDRLARFPSSGLTVAQFAIEAVSLPSFYTWKRRLAAEAQEGTTQNQGRDLGPRLLSVRLPTLGTGCRTRPDHGCRLAFAAGL